MMYRMTQSSEYFRTLLSESWQTYKDIQVFCSSNAFATISTYLSCLPGVHIGLYIEFVSI